MAPMLVVVVVVVVSKNQLGGKADEDEEVEEDKAMEEDEEVEEDELWGVEEEEGAVDRALVARAPAALWDVVPDIAEAGDEVLGIVLIALEL